MAGVGVRDKVGILVLGRGEDDQHIQDWLAIGPQTPGFNGFVVGRTVFWQSLVDYKDGSMSWVGAFGLIAGNYLQKYRLFVGARSGATA